MSTNWAVQFLVLEELKKCLMDKVNMVQCSDSDPVDVNEVAGTFEHGSIKEWVGLLMKQGEKMLVYARALALMRGNDSVTRQHIKKAFKMVDTGLDKHLLDFEQDE